MLTGFTAVFMACSFALIGNHSLRAIGFEWGVLWLIATVIFIRGYVVAIRAGMSFIGLTTPRLAGGTMCYFAEVIGAILLILGYSAGLYIAAIVSGWMNQGRLQIMEYLRKENRVLREQLGGRQCASMTISVEDWR